MSFRSILNGVRDGFGSLSRRHRRCSVHELEDPVELDPVQQTGLWSNLPRELLREVIGRIEASESAWPARMNVVACAAVCRSWREMCMEIVKCPEFSGKITFPLSLKQPGPRDGLIQCFIKRDKSTQTYCLFLCLSQGVLLENGKFLLAAKRHCRPTYTEYIISIDSENITRSKDSYIGKLRSNFLGTKFVIYDSQPPYKTTIPSQNNKNKNPNESGRLFIPRKVSPKVSPRGGSGGSSSYPISHVSYELNVLGTRGPRRMQCVMHSIPATAVLPGGTVPAPPPGSSGCLFFRSMDFGSSRFSEITVDLSAHNSESKIGNSTENKLFEPLILRNKAPRWHEQLQCWCLNFRGRVTVASVKNFQLVAAAVPPPATGAPAREEVGPVPDQDKVILQFGKVGKDMFTMDYGYPLSAFQAFAICLSSFDTKLACE